MKNSTTPIWFVPALAVSVAGDRDARSSSGLLRGTSSPSPSTATATCSGWRDWQTCLSSSDRGTAVGANRLWPGVHTESAAALVFFALGAFGLLKYLPRVGNLAFLLIAIGIGVRGSAIVMRRREAFHAGIRRLALTLPVILLVAAATAFAWTPLRERWLNRNLPAASENSPTYCCWCSIPFGRCG